MQFQVSSTPEGGPPVKATITRNGDLSAPLTITITNSRPDKLQAPTNIVLAAGQATAQFQVNGLLDGGVVDGDHLAELTATASGYITSSATITVLDIDKPNLLLQLPAAPIAAGAPSKE